MKKLIIFTISFIIWSNIPAEEKPLYSAYQQYASVSKEANTILPLLRFYSDKQYLSFEQYFTHKDLKHGIDTLFSRLKFPAYLQKVILHKEIITQNTGCLMVAGLSKEKKQTAIYVGYSKTHQWLIDSINVEFLNDNESFLEKPICNTEKLQQKRMEAWVK